MTEPAQTLHELAVFFGLPSLELNDRGEVAVAIGTEDEFLLELHENQLFASVARPLPRHSRTAAETALSLCDASLCTHAVRAGLSVADKLVFTMTVPLQEISPQRLLQVLDVLLTLQNTVRQKESV